MKRTVTNSKRDPELKRQLELVRSTIRVLTPAELEHVNGGDGSKQQQMGTCIPLTID